MTTRQQIEALEKRLQEIEADEKELKEEKRIVVKTITNLKELQKFDEEPCDCEPVSHETNGIDGN